MLAVGVGDPCGKISTCQLEDTLLSGFAGCVQPNVADVNVIPVTFKRFGFLQVGGGEHDTAAIHPGLLTNPSLLNLKVKQPSGLDDVNGPGIAVPQ